MKIGLIGAGRIGAFHAGTLSALDAVGSLLITDANPDAATAVAAKHGAQTVASTQELFAAGLDGVIIASSTATHLPLLQASITAGVPTFCEKPVSEDPAAASGLLPLIQETGVPVQIGFPRRFDPDFVAAKAALDSGTLGWLTTVRSTTMDPAPPPPSYIAGSGGIFRDCAIHDFDTVRWATGREVLDVYAIGDRRGDQVFSQVDDVSTASTLLTLDDGTIGIVSNTRYNGEGYDVRLELHGSEGSIAAGLDDGLPFQQASPGLDFPSGPAHTFFMDRLTEAFRVELGIFVDVAAGRTASPCTIVDGLEASWIAEAATLSRREHRPVRIDEVRR